ncbi:MAG: hypothetical protein CM1200mP29_09520 [Verrucomicrobiota bacterium]|nr:MAG: hypothetical protein CM1200mP29_09520 [Verrucomicrobiota bacterium]
MPAARKASARKGILAGGNWIIDQVKMIDVYPQREQLANITGATVTGTGGSPYNLLVNLAKLNAGIPLAAAGLVGKDAFGNLILEDCARHSIDTKLLKATSDAPTSYTDVMTETKGGNRTFFHNRGANALWDGSDLDFNKTGPCFFTSAICSCSTSWMVPTKNMAPRRPGSWQRRRRPGCGQVSTP